MGIWQNKMKRQEKTQDFIFSNRDLLCLVFPLAIELALKLIVGLIDSVMVSSVGEAAISGVSLVDSVMQLLIYIFAALASGGAVVAGQYLGAKKEKSGRQAASELLWLNILLSIGIMLVVLLFSNWIMTHLFGRIENEVYYHAQRYFYVVACSIPAIAIFEAGTAIFRTMSNSKTTMKISLLMNIINGIGNAIFIYGFSMGTQGAAAATLLSRWIAAVLIVVLLLDPHRELHIERTWKHRFNL